MSKTIRRQLEELSVGNIINDSEDIHDLIESLRENISIIKTNLVNNK
ncbi:MAG: hypothetical protein ACOCRK_07975 [bacterium]